MSLLKSSASPLLCLLSFNYSNMLEKFAQYAYGSEKLGTLDAVPRLKKTNDQKASKIVCRLIGTALVNDGFDNLYYFCIENACWLLPIIQYAISQPNFLPMLYYLAIATQGCCPQFTRIRLSFAFPSIRPMFDSDVTEKQLVISLAFIVRTISKTIPSFSIDDKDGRCYAYTNIR